MCVHAGKCATAQGIGNFFFKISKISSSLNLFFLIYAIYSIKRLDLLFFYDVIHCVLMFLYVSILELRIACSVVMYVWLYYLNSYMWEYMIYIMRLYYIILILELSITCSVVKYVWWVVKYVWCVVEYVWWYYLNSYDII